MSTHYLAQKLHSNFIDQIKDYAVFAIDTQGCVATWNEGAERLKGYQEAEIVGHYYGLLFPDEYQQAGKPQEELGGALKDGTYEIEDWRKKKDGSLFWASVTLTSIYSDKGEHIGFTKVTGDKTEHKKLQEKLAKRNNKLKNRNKELRRINRDLDYFIYTASHDLKSPILNIEGLMRLLTDELQENSCLTDETEEMVKRVLTSVERFKGTIEDLTEISRMHKNINGALLEETINIKEEYEKLLADLESPVKQHICFLQTDFQVSQLKFSRKNFRSILYNLISNAVKFQSPERDCIVHIQTLLEEPYVVLSVQDNGLGLNECQLEQLFTMFKRFHSHTDGTGIGLFIVKRIIENAGGKIKVESEEGKGTEFKVYFKVEM